MLDSPQPGNIRLILKPELKELANSTIAMQIQQAIDSKLNVSCKLEFIARQGIETETPYETRQQQQELERQAAICTIKASETVRKFNQAFGAELVENSVRKRNQ